MSGEPYDEVLAYVKEPYNELVVVRSCPYAGLRYEIFDWTGEMTRRRLSGSGRIDFSPHEIDHPVPVEYYIPDCLFKEHGKVGLDYEVLGRC